MRVPSKYIRGLGMVVILASLVIHTRYRNYYTLQIVADLAMLASLVFYWVRADAEGRSAKH
jgi:hypothetical protein